MKGPNTIFIMNINIGSYVDSKSLRHFFKQIRSVFDGSASRDCKSVPTVYSVRRGNVAGHCSRCSSSWIDWSSQCGQNRCPEGTRFHLPVSLRSLWEQRRILEKVIRRLSSTQDWLSVTWYNGWTERSGFSLEYGCNFVLSGGMSRNCLQRSSRSSAM